MKDLTFIIPIRHPDNLRDPQSQVRILNKTFKSYLAQTDDNWQVVIVANHGTLLPELPAGFHVVWVDYPPNPKHELKDHDHQAAMGAILRDKGSRIAEGIRSFPDTHYYMLMDDDDFVSAQLTAFVKANRGQNGWYVNNGYGLDLDGSLTIALDRFHKVSGSSHIVRRDLYRLPDQDDPDYEQYIMRWLGTHGPTTELFEEIGEPLAPLPFFGAAYMMSNPNSHSNTNSVLRGYVINKDTLRRPWSLFGKLARLKRINAAFRAEFFGEA